MPPKKTPASKKVGAKPRPSSAPVIPPPASAELGEMQDLASLLGRLPGIKSVGLDDVKSLVELLKDTPELGAIEVQGLFGTGITLTRTGVGAAAVPQMPMAMPQYAPPAPAAAPAAPAAAAAPAPAAPSLLKDIKSPMIGTFYRSPEPGAEPYAQVGTRVSIGQTLCIIEAMKIMNEIEAEVAGVVREVVADDSGPVEFGQVLFRIDPNG